MIIPENIRKLDMIDYQFFGISNQSAVLFECIRKNKKFPPIDDVNDSVVYSLAKYTMISHLTKLREQFEYINFAVINIKIKIVDLVINRRQVKSARNIS